MKDMVRKFGVELEGYTTSSLYGNRIHEWKGVQDGSLHDCEDECCGRCDGDGYHYETCGICEGDRTIQCGTCEGSGNANCYTCGGSGITLDNVNCPNCNGDGTEYCSDCNGSGEVRCNNCDSDGEVRVDCQTCEGTGNINNGKYGVEFVSPVLTNTESLHQVMSSLHGYDWRVDDTCGTHIHVDARDFEAKDIVKLVMLNVAFEPILFSLISDDRYNAHYTKQFDNNWYHKILPLKNADAIDLMTIMYGGARSGFDKYESQRYYGLNLHSWFYRKTIEFRYFNGQTNSDRVEKLIELVTTIVEFAKNATYEQCLIIAHDFRKMSLIDSMKNIGELLGLSFDISQLIVAGSNYDWCIRNQSFTIPVLNVISA